MEPHYDYAEAFQTAARAVGGEKQLADRLGVGLDELRAWIESGSRPPLEVFLRALDVIELSA